MVVLSGISANTSSLGILDIMSALGSLLIIILVIVLTFFVSRWYARKMSGGVGTQGGRLIKVVDRVGLGQSASLVIVEVGEKHYLVGLSEKNIQMLCELEDFQRFINENPANSPEPFGQMIRSLMDKASHPKNKRDDGGAQ